ncbi:MAG TPA: MoaD/ThiS family protein [Anaeromyxobacteraceae bacterium]|nr:MoaD/ThiS family protein [Anaeromyxobacteraceae bacterium]
MELTIRLFATFRDGRFQSEKREYPPETLLGNIVDDLKLARDEIGVMLVNGRHASFEQKLAPGDAVSIFPQVGGG